MGFRKKIKNNKPKVELQSIMTLIAGGYKTGKTRLWKEVTELHYLDPEEALLLSFEDGYETWELDNIVPLHEEGTDKTLWKVWDFFKKSVVPDLVEEAKTNRIVKLIGIDTADRAIDACVAWVINDRNKKYGKSFDSLQDISDSTKENGWTALYDELKKPFDTLKNAGYGLMSLAWTKEKETTLYDGMKYNSIQLMMNNTGKKVFESQASLICCLHSEVSVLDKQGNELEDNLKDKKGKDRASNFHETKVMMYFRPSEFVDIAGGRYTELPEKVPYSAQNFLDVFENAVKGQLKKTTKTVSELKTEETAAREERTKEYTEKVENDPVHIMQEIDELVKDLGRDVKEKLVSSFTEAFGMGNYKQLKTPEDLSKALSIVKEAI
ncbi:AAA family ATPase [Bacillus atrophaeus]|uniref:AAA family ATPase n=1 Tax=Bacillus atrophaeus TaxID=1452 RepID=UPI0022825CD1|nr:AAA family ATPase [Bacillus atrophaeus]MCY8810607.1 ATP-binding protein [Bacillus atrophaeus]MCY8907759.1 ATP-binding protein [Bacillus atrophaeus]MEC0837764.1 AAA family ATPase [Bacillus atrophaeus]MEC0847665.1 AAA family ATPase [Bacillus atrophaeus]MEC0849885.1 AAA family ATPase [Bacillus atrophaeus]